MAQVMEDRVVVDFSSGWPGSVATMVLSDFGAEVIKVEPPAGDPHRAFPQHLLWNRGKKSIVLDLETEEGRAKARQLAAQADVVIESFAPGEADALGIGYETLSAQRPDLVYCSISAFGPKGQYANYKPYESVVAAKVGRYSVFTGQAGRPRPTLRRGEHCRSRHDNGRPPGHPFRPYRTRQKPELGRRSRPASCRASPPSTSATG